MYDIIADIIGHVWQTTGTTGEQPYIYTCCVMLIVMFFVFFIRAVASVFRLRA